jgi:putative FmdB family regulatory protein
MPFYEYECENCQHCTEVLQKISDPLLTTCPECGKEALRKVLSAPVFRLKGKGWYETDFKSDGESKRNLAGPDKEEPKVEAKTEEKPKTESKPEPKESKPAEAPAAPPPVKRKRQAAGAARGATRRAAGKASGAKPVKAKGKTAASKGSR